MDNTLINIKIENSLSIVQNTIIAFQKQHPNLNLTPSQITWHWTQLKNKNELIFKCSQPKPWALIKDEYLFELDKKLS
jgi:hypothetical protein